MTVKKKKFIFMLALCAIALLLICLLPGCKWLTPPFVGVTGPSVDITKKDAHKRKVTVTVRYPTTQPATVKEVQP